MTDNGPNFTVVRVVCSGSKLEIEVDWGSGGYTDNVVVLFCTLQEILQSYNIIIIIGVCATLTKCRLLVWQGDPH